MRSSDKPRVGLIFGGRSREHEISIRSAHAVAAALDRERFHLTLIGIDPDGHWHLYTEEGFRRIEKVVATSTTAVAPVRQPNGCSLIDLEDSQRTLPILDVVFPVLHGPYGEDGTIQGLLEILDVPYVGAGVLGSAIGMDKDVQKRLLRDAGVPIVPFEVVTQRRWTTQAEVVRTQAQQLGPPLFVKPANLGSSVGISKVSALTDLNRAIEHALAHDRKILLERGIDAREIECAVLGNDEPRASLPGEIVPAHEFYSYQAKYAADSEARLLIPAPISARLRESVQSMALRAFEVLECTSMARVDCFLERDTGELYVNEVNTIPGFTSISMYPKLWEATGVRYRNLISRLIDLALEGHQDRRWR